MMPGSMAGSWPEHDICSAIELPESAARGFECGSGDWPFRGFVLRRGGRVFAYANICPHRRHMLDMVPGHFLVDDGQFLRCASHGALFVPETGETVAGPCVGKRLLALQVTERDGRILVCAPDSLQDVIDGVCPHPGPHPPGSDPVS